MHFKNDCVIIKEPLWTAPASCGCSFYMDVYGAFPPHGAAGRPGPEGWDETAAEVVRITGRYGKIRKTRRCTETESRENSA